MSVNQATERALCLWIENLTRQMQQFSIFWRKSSNIYLHVYHPLTWNKCTCRKMWVYNYFLTYTQNYHHYKQVLVMNMQKIKQHFSITSEEPPFGIAFQIYTMTINSNSHKQPMVWRWVYLYIRSLQVPLSEETLRTQQQSRVNSFSVYAFQRRGPSVHQLPNLLLAK